MTPITSSVPSTAASAGSVARTVNSTEIASNFTTFLQLLTTQLKNQDPLSPMDTNQFTQQLVEFASVEQQMKSNSSLTTLVSLEQAAQSTSALALVGATVVVDGLDHAAQQRQSQLEPQRHKAGDRDGHHQGRDRPDRLYQHLRRQSGHSEFHLGRPRH